MSDLLSPLLVTMNDEAHAYLCFCALMQRLKKNFLADGIAMTQKFTHLSEGLLYYDPEYYAYLKRHQVISLLLIFCETQNFLCNFLLKIRLQAYIQL
jgi:hypothetical protein